MISLIVDVFKYSNTTKMDSVLFGHHHCPGKESFAEETTPLVLVKPGSSTEQELASTTRRCTCKYPKIRIPEAVAFFLWHLSIIAGNVHLAWIDAWQCFEPSQFVPQLPSEETPYTFTSEICYWGLRNDYPIIKLTCENNGMVHEYSVRLTASSCGISRKSLLEILTCPAGMTVYRAGFQEEAYRRLRPQMGTAAEAYVIADTIAQELTKEQITAEARSFVSALFSQ